MTETGWQAVGRIAKARRERLGLNQDELADYGGPKVATVGKFERATQDFFPLRTQHQMENALGWPRTIVEQVVRSIDEGTLEAADWEYDLIEEGIPDLSRPARRDTEDPEAELESQVQLLRSVLGLVPNERRTDATRAGAFAMLEASRSATTSDAAGRMEDGDIAAAVAHAQAELEAMGGEPTPAPIPAPPDSPAAEGARKILARNAPETSAREREEEAPTTAGDVSGTRRNSNSS